MIIGIGTDLVEVARIGKALERHGDKFAARILTELEMQIYNERSQSVSFVAKRFAIKEAIGKVLGTGIAQGVSWHDMNVLPDELGAPQVTLSGKALHFSEALLLKLAPSRQAQWHVTITDERKYALAFAVLSARE